MGRRVSPTMFVRHILTPERRLWRAVLQQACADADSAAEFDPDSGLTVRTIARRFLRAASPGEAGSLELVCDFADVPYDRVVLWARKRYPSEPAEPEPVDEIIAGQIIPDEIGGDEIIAVQLSGSAPN